MAKRKKNKIVVRPWCWYCEREFEDEKVLMQHQKAKHFKCHQCPRRLNTAGGLAVHIQQVHKLDPDQLPRIDNAMPGRDGYEVEIFGMEGIPAPDVADYKRRKEIELGLPPGSISGSGKGLQPNKRPRIENRVLTEEELRVQLEAHKALMGAADSAPPPASTPGTAVYNAAPQTYVAQPVPAAVPPPFMPGMPPPPGLPPFPPGAPGSVPPFPPFPPGPGMPPGPPPPGFPMPPPGLLRPGIPLPPFPPGGPPVSHGASAGTTPIPPGPTPPFPPTPAGMTPPNVSSALSNGSGPTVPALAPPTPTPSSKPPPSNAPSQPRTPLPPNPPQTNPPLKAGTLLMWSDANYSPIEKRAQENKYQYVAQLGDEVAAEKTVAGEGGPRGTKRARAEDFM